MKDRCKSLFLKIREIWKTYWVYIIIMLISALVRGVPVSSGNSSLDEALNDIAIGAFASALVAWLILVQDQNRMKKHNQELCEYTMSPFLEALITYMQNFCRAIAIENKDMRNQTHTFPEWSGLYFLQLSENLESPVQRFHGMDADFLRASLNRITEKSKQILDNAVWFQKEGVLKREECDLIYKIGALCEASKIFTLNKQSTLSINTINQELSKLIQESDLANLITIKYSHDLPLENYFIRRG